MLNDLRRPAGEGFDAGLHGPVLPAHPDGAVPLRFPHAVQRKTAFFRFVAFFPGQDLRVEHLRPAAAVLKDDDPFRHADHVGGHAHTAVCIGLQRIHQIIGSADIRFRRRQGGLRQKNGVTDKGPDHRCRTDRGRWGRHPGIR